MDDLTIVDMYANKNIKITHLMQLSGYSYPKIKNILMKHNVFVQRGNSNSGRKRIYDVDDNYFEEINNKEKAYWLGFLWGDGYITNNGKVVGISLSYIDKNHLQKFKESIKFSGNINTYTCTNGYKIGTKYCRIHISSKKMVDDLMKLGFKANKSLTMTPPIHNAVPQKYVHHFIRGIQDANGSICYWTDKHGKEQYQAHILGTIPMLEYILSNIGYCTKQKYYARKKDCPVYDIRFNITNNTIKYLDYLYQNSDVNIVLDRKYEKYNYIKNKIAK